MAGSNPGQYAYSLGMAAGNAELASLIWRRGNHSRHRLLYHLAARSLLLYDAFDNGIAGPIHNWTETRP